MFYYAGIVSSYLVHENLKRKAAKSTEIYAAISIIAFDLTTYDDIIAGCPRRPNESWAGQEEGLQHGEG